MSMTKGAIAWMATHKVTANLLMILLLAGGLVSGLRLKQEVFPDFKLDTVTVTVSYPGASPAEVEKGVILAVEEAIRGMEGIEEVESTATEGSAVVSGEILSGFEPNKILNDVKSEIDRITTFPVEVEKTTVSLASRERSVLSLAVSGRQTEQDLRVLAESIRAELLTSPEVTVVNLRGVRQPEVSIEVSEEHLRAYGLTLQGIADRISQSSLEVPGGKIKTDSGEILLRTSERKYYGREFVNLPIVTRQDGSTVLLSEIATVRETFEDSDIRTYYNGKPAALLEIFRVGDQKPADVSAAAKEVVARMQAELPEGVEIAVWNDMSEALQDRIDLLFKNTFFGLVLVLMLLSLFLEPRLAFWVTMGIPISILGALLFMPAVDASINMVTLFAFLITIGVVVDDAVVVGEHIFSLRQEGKSYVQAAILGAREMAAPVTFSILTNVVAFLPLMFVPGMLGKMFFYIPLIVITIFLISLFEALFILPAHLADGADRPHTPSRLERMRLRFGRGLQHFIDKVFQPFLELSLRWRYVTVSFGFMCLMMIAGMVASGRAPFNFFSAVEGDVVSANLALPIGTPVAETEAFQKRLTQVAREILEEHGGESILRGSMVRVGAASGNDGASSVQGGHLAIVNLLFVPVDERDITTEEFANLWRARFGTPSDIESLTFKYTEGPNIGSPIHVALSHNDADALEAAASELAEVLATFDGVTDVNDGFSDGKVQWDFKIKPAGQAAGLTAADIAGQVRSAFFGAEAQRSQRDRDEVKVYVRYPESQRKSPQDVRELILRTPNGGEMPIGQAVEIVEGRAYTSIRRSDGRRVINVTADVARDRANGNQVLRELQADQLARLMADYPGLSYTLRGVSKEQSESLSSLAVGFGLALFGIYALLAIPFNSYSQPLIIMISIPFGMVGAVIGHLIMGYELSLMSMMGLVALSGVVVNDSLILIVAANRGVQNGKPVFRAVVDAARSRFRPIIITSLSTCLGLGPMILETSVQARFLIPMAISLGFGILFATVIALLLVPSFYMILDDAHRLFDAWFGRDMHVEAVAGEPVETFA
ncbi:Efflux RND transporter permease subunit [Sulfidibacter corallicola]|uniref:Efflux RND transporter permease subunit n=1 Tax=Sulfidibacter corallicola TaxID=2818388 RepID=A0A8A4TFK1_SULCO|nr:efflux RND transporter permease subunit [Sulfidibacter corallicola]QTD47972.1 efflux RND transporter permease subunit [Sulfidibacter corallicola]